MACNIPVGATNVGDVVEVIGRTKGCSVCLHDPHDLANGLEQALQRAEPTTGRSDISQYKAGELVIEDATRIFCHSVVLKRLAERGLDVRVMNSVHILAITINPYTPEYVCTSQLLLDTLIEELPPLHAPIIDVVSGLFTKGMM